MSCDLLQVSCVLADDDVMLTIKPGQVRTSEWVVMCTGISGEVCTLNNLPILGLVRSTVRRTVEILLDVVWL